MCTEDTEVTEKEWGFVEISNGVLGCFKGVSKDFQGISRGVPRGGGQWGFRGFPAEFSGGFRMDVLSDPWLIKINGQNPS